MDENNNVIKAAVITGCFAIVATIIGALATHWFGLATPSPNPTPTQSTTSSSTTPAAAGGGSGANGSRGPTSIYHQGILKVANYTCVDLDAAPSDPQWGETAVGTAAGGVDLCSEYPSFAGTNNATLVTVAAGTDTTCQNATGWLPTDSYQNLQLSVGSYVCGHTNQGRFSLLRVMTIDAANAITFQVKTFKKPGDA